jgi:hypothetical protein
VTGVGVPAFLRQEQAYPPCEQLPTTAEVRQAIAIHPGLVRSFTDVGPDVSVTVRHPCEDLPDRALVSVDYTSDQQQTRIDRIFTTHDGFGVPATTQKR